MRCPPLANGPAPPRPRLENRPGSSFLMRRQAVQRHALTGVSYIAQILGAQWRKLTSMNRTHSGCP